MILNKQAIRVIAAGLIGELTGQRIAKTLSYFNEKIGGTFI